MTIVACKKIGLSKTSKCHPSSVNLDQSINICRKYILFQTFAPSFVHCCLRPKYLDRYRQEIQSKRTVIAADYLQLKEIISNCELCWELEIST